jgi:hypothetical protein
MHSALVAYQLALFGGTVGIKQTKIEAVDLENLRIPALEHLAPGELEALAKAADMLASSADARVIKATLVDVDRIVSAAVKLTEADRALLSDTDLRDRSCSSGNGGGAERR